MQRLAILILTLACLTGCTASEQLQTGDLIFVGIPADSGESGSIGEAIALSTGDGELNMIHTAIVEVDAEGIWIIDATLKHGVDRHPLDTLFADFRRSDGSMPEFEVMRLCDTRDVSSFVESAKTHIGEGYDVYFMPDNGMHYCTELVYDSYIRDGEHLFEAAPMNFKGPDGEYPQYWVRLFQRIGKDIPQGVDGTNPQDMYGSDRLRKVEITILGSQLP